MARVPIYLEVKDSAGNGVASASVTVKDRSTGVNVTLYNAEVAGSTIANPTIADSLGRVMVWADPVNFSATISGTGITTYTIYFDGTGIPPDNSITATKIVNSSVTADDIADAAKLGLTDSTSVRRGKSNIATTESRTNTAYGLLATPDRVQNIVLPTDGLIFIAAAMTWQNSVVSAGRAAIFIGANQLRIAAQVGSSPQMADEASLGVANEDHALTTIPTGLSGNAAGVPTAYTGDVTTGQAIGYQAGSGGPVAVFAAAGTYDVSVQWKSSSGSITAKNRKLWVWTVGF